MSFFFEGAASREVTASAWLATLLSDPAFRITFLKQITQAEVLGPGDEWNVAVERNRHDIELQCAAQKTIFIIENKISSASFTMGQLPRYAEAESIRTPGQRIGVILVAPTDGTGRRELERLKNAFPDEQVKGWLVSWEQVADLAKAHRWSSDFTWFVETGIHSIKNAIASSRQEQWALENGREVLESIVSSIRDQLQEDGSRWKTWRLSNYHRVHSTDSPITVCADVGFQIDAVTDSQLPVKDDQGIHVKLTIKIHLSNAGQRDKSRLARWREALELIHDVPGLGDVMRPSRNSKWMHCDVAISPEMDERQIALHAARKARKALDWANGLGK